MSVLVFLDTRNGFHKFERDTRYCSVVFYKSVTHCHSIVIRHSFVSITIVNILFYSSLTIFLIYIMIRYNLYKVI